MPVQLVVARIKSGVALVEDMLVLPNQVHQEARRDQKDRKNSRSNAFVEVVLLPLSLLGLVLHGRRALGVELDIQHEAGRHHEEDKPPLDAKDGALPPPPHSVVRVEARGLIEARRAHSRQPDREEKLQGEHGSGDSGQEHDGDHHEEAGELHDGDMPHAGGEGEVIRELEALLHGLRREQLGDDGQGLEGRQPLLDDAFREEPRVVLQLRSPLALDVSVVLDDHHLCVGILRELHPGIGSGGTHEARQEHRV
mmetsp:Transcript_51213/g.130061  ORF Transcript_51213/g.130061 Transcript_51213/m.130061 type:complete len:253 (+) Transcript_51213:145-903(+)